MLFGEGPQIKNIAADLNKLFRQGSLLNQIGQTIEGDSTADQGTSDLLAARDPVIQEISVGMSGEQSARYTVSGTPPLSLPNSLGKPLKAWSVEVSPYQEGTGDPAPDNVRPIHGTNKLNLFVADSYDPTATPTAVIDVPPLSANQWDEEWEQGNIDGDGQDKTGNDVIRSKGYIPASPSTSYYVYSGANKRIYMFAYDADKTFIERTNVGALNWVYTTPDSTKYLRFATRDTYGNTYNHDIAINYPSTVTTYNPYTNTVYTGTIGSEGGESRWGEVDLGTLNYLHFVSSGRQIFRTESIPDIKGMVSSSTPVNAICEAYTPKAYNATWSDGNFAYAFGNVGTNQLVFIDNRFTEVADFKAAVTGIKLIYELATSTTFSVPSVTIPTPTGTATTWATAEDGTIDSMEVTYVGRA